MLSPPVHCLIDIFLSRFLFIKILFCFSKPQVLRRKHSALNHLQSKESCLQCSHLLHTHYSTWRFLIFTHPRLRQHKLWNRYRYTEQHLLQFQCFCYIFSKLLKQYDFNVVVVVYAIQILCCLMLWVLMQMPHFLYRNLSFGTSCE